MISPSLGITDERRPGRTWARRRANAVAKGSTPANGESPALKKRGEGRHVGWFRRAGLTQG